MAAWVATIPNSGSTTNADSYAFAAFTPAADELLVVFVRSGDTAVAGVLTSDVGITFTNVARTHLNASVDFVDTFVANSLATAVSTTLTWSCTGDAANGRYACGFRISGMTRTGLSAVRQFKEQENQAAGTPAPVFDAACLTGNMTLAVMGNLTNPSGMTGPSGWTVRVTSGYNTPPTGIYTSTRNSGFTGTTVTWGSASASVFGAVVLELDTSAPPPVITAPRTQARYSWR